ncbi:hypothetical protein SAMN02745216_04116 [Desulfatibacillum alkenivorans DSM 16219]|uniref:Uncharacterized protein n=1 Tax=Desulfatibacillum alkenivorans DSM 16219 TaxID=1121393 RepID=A0A1M6VI33_9BACT|nr:hypothetical protein [Desulfatibacillum alkenivorans]SHK81015.1 hypothetical protein SAMN02745216_04116 [Desulfatibacillum alkenivorans DSM 16219]
MLLRRQSILLWTIVLFLITAVSAAAFQTSDLTGTWHVHRLLSGDAPDAVGWEYGTCDITPGGVISYTGTSTCSGEVTETGALSVDSSGQVSVAEDASYSGALNAGKDLIVGSYTAPGGGRALEIALKRTPGMVFSQADLAGTWRIYGLVSGDSPAQTPGWTYQTQAILDATGNGVYGTPQYNSMGTSWDHLINALPMDSNGIMSFLSEDGPAHGAMSDDKNLLVIAGTGCPGYKDDVCGFNMQIWVRAGVTCFSQEDLAGYWTIHGLVAGDASAGANFIGWTRSTGTLDHAGWYETDAWETSSGSSDPAATAIPVTFDGLVSFMSDGVSAGHGAVMASKDFWVLVQNDGGGGFSLVTGVRQKAAPRVFGDFNYSGNLDLGDAIQILQILAGQRSNTLDGGIQAALERFEAILAKDSTSVDDPDWDYVISRNFMDFGRDREDYLAPVVNGSLQGAVFEGMQIVEVADGDPPRVRISCHIMMPDGSRFFVSHLWFTQENGVWLMTGDGLPMEFEVDASAALNQNTGTVQENGIGFRAHDYYHHTVNKGIDNILVTGPGLPSQGLVMQVVDNSDPDDVRYRVFKDDEAIELFQEADGLDTSVIPNNARYVFTPRDASGNAVFSQSFTKTLPLPPLSNAELESNPQRYFPLLTAPEGSVLSSFDGGDLTVKWTEPDALDDPNVIKVEVEWASGSGKGGGIYGAALAVLTGLDASLGQADTADFTLECYDKTMREFTTHCKVDVSDSIKLVLASYHARYASGVPFSLETRSAGSPEQIIVVDENGLPPASPYALSIYSSSGNVWQMENIPAGVSEISMGVVPEGADEVFAFTNTSANGTYWAELKAGNHKEKDSYLWKVTDGEPMSTGSQVAVNMSNPQGISFSGYLGIAFIDSNDEIYMNLFEYTGGSESFSAVPPSGDWIWFVSVATDTGGNGWLPLFDHELHDVSAVIPLGSNELLGGGNSVDLELSSMQVQGGVRFQDASGILQSPPANAVIELEAEDYEDVEGAFIPQSDGSFSGSMHYLKKVGDAAIPQDALMEVNVFLDVHRTGDVGHNSFVFAELDGISASNLGTVQNPLATITGHSLNITVNGILGDDQWLCHPTNQILTASSNTITGILYSHPSGSDDVDLFYDRNGNGWVENEEDNVNIQPDATSFSIPENLLFCLFQFKDDVWHNMDFELNNNWQRWYGHRSTSSKGEGLAVIGLGNAQPDPNLPTAITLFQDANHNGHLDSGEDHAVLNNIPALTDRYCLDYPDVIQASDFSPWP